MYVERTQTASQNWSGNSLHNLIPMFTTSKKKRCTWCEFDRASLLIHGNKRPTRCNRLVFYCKTYCSLNMFRAPLCPSSGALQLYRWLLSVILGSWVYRSLVWCGTVGYVSSLRDTARLAFRAVFGLVWSCGLCVRFVGYCSTIRNDLRIENGHDIWDLECEESVGQGYWRQLQEKYWSIG
jgi:hypothetical protein